MSFFALCIIAMKKTVIAFSALAILFAGAACNPKESDTAKESKCPEGAVDLGIVMTREDGSTYKIYWAKSNLCKSGLCANPEDYGDYYAWEEVSSKESDPARAKLGGKWRTPTDAELTALVDQCTWTWTTQNGVHGRLVTASNGNSIFLPGSGYRDDTDQFFAEGHGYYWSSSLRTSEPDNAWGLYFNSMDFSRYLFPRFHKQSIRPVSE